MSKPALALASNMPRNRLIMNTYSASALSEFATGLLTQSGLPEKRAQAVAEILVEGDLLGHNTHGLQLLGPYLTSIEAGSMTLAGEPTVLADHGANITWDGHYLPGPWLIKEAIALAESRLPTTGMATVVIRRSHHIACLQSYLKAVTDRGHLILLTCSDPNPANGSVAPHGGLRPLYTPNPFAAGIPTKGQAILMDISMSTTTNGLSNRLIKSGDTLPGEWVKDAEGNPTNDPKAVFSDPPGSILPLGGLDLGHKGFALGLLVEALTSALAGYGHAEAPDQWGASVFLQIIDPGAFGGLENFMKETSWMVDACHQNPVKPGDPPVRMPGEAGLKRREEQLAHGVSLYPGILESLQPWQEKLNTPMPTPLES